MTNGRNAMEGDAIVSEPWRGETGTRKGAHTREAKMRRVLRGENPLAGNLST